LILYIRWKFKLLCQLNFWIEIQRKWWWIMRIKAPKCGDDHHHLLSSISFSYMILCDLIWSRITSVFFPGSKKQGFYLLLLLPHTHTGSKILYLSRSQIYFCVMNIIYILYYIYLYTLLTVKIYYYYIFFSGFKFIYPIYIMMMISMNNNNNNNNNNKIQMIQIECIESCTKKMKQGRKPYYYYH